VCKAHYSRFQRLLDVAMRRGPSRGSLLADFAAHMNVAESLESLVGANRAALLAGGCGGGRRRVDGAHHGVSACHRSRFLAFALRRQHLARLGAVGGIRKAPYLAIAIVGKEF
jgi:hypothetical protein